MGNESSTKRRINGDNNVPKTKRFLFARSSRGWLSIIQLKI
jgi:hypothetical protein